ncbi:hypothetical protein EDC04DRAFT_2566006, partial [Pisolithus marmoratus]
ASKANLTVALLPFETGGSWKKSPVTTTCRNVSGWACNIEKHRACIPPKGSEDFRIIPPNLASLSNKSPSSMETR